MPLDVNAMIAQVGQAARADDAERAADSARAGQDNADIVDPTGQIDAPEIDQDEPEVQPTPPPASSTIQPPTQTDDAGSTVADLLGMDAAAIDRLVGALNATPPSGGPGAPAAAPSSQAAPAQPSPTPGQAQHQTVDLRFVTDEQIDSQADIIGDEGVALLKQMAASQRAMHEHYERQMADARGVVEHYKEQEQKQVEKTVGGFFAGMKDLGLDQKYGSGPVPTTPEQAQARMALGATADRIWAALGGKPERLEEALKGALLATDRQAMEEAIAQRARAGVHGNLQKRRGMLDVTPGGSGGPQAPLPNDPDKAGLAMASQFVAAQRG